MEQIVNNDNDNRQEPRGKLTVHGLEARGSLRIRDYRVQGRWLYGKAPKAGWILIILSLKALIKEESLTINLSKI